MSIFYKFVGMSEVEEANETEEPDKSRNQKEKGFVDRVKELLNGG